MISIFTYNKQTRSFSAMSTVNKLNKYGGLAVTAMGAAAAGIGLARTISDKSKFTIVYNTGAGPKQNVIKADSKNEALKRFGKNSYNNNFIKSARAFRLPDEDDKAKAYMDQLRSQSSNRTATTNSGKL